MSSLTLQVDDGLVFLSLFQVFEFQSDGFVPAQTTGKQQRKQRAISFAFQADTVGSLPECDTLLRT